MILPEQVFKNYHDSYGSNLTLLFDDNSNIISQESLRSGKYYGFSGEGSIDRLSNQWTTFHIIRYNGPPERGIVDIHCLFSLYFYTHRSERTIFWTNGMNSDDISRLNNIKFYILPKNIRRDMIRADNSLSNNDKNEMIIELENDINQDYSQQPQSNIPVCSICMTNPLDRVLSCGHTLCSTCVNNPGYRNCHMCRLPINRYTNVMPLYIS
jgi:hypothetical protein